MAYNVPRIALLILTASQLWLPSASKKTLEDILPISWMADTMTDIFEDVIPMESNIDLLSQTGERPKQLAQQLRTNVERAIRENSNIFEQSKCAEHVLYLADSIIDDSRVTNLSTTKWPRQMMDAYGKLESATLQGYYNWTGDMKQCIQINVWTTAGNNQLKNISPDFKGKYCLATFVAKDYYLESKQGICIPSTCFSKEIITIFTTIANADDYLLMFNENNCHTNETEPMDTTTIVIWVLFAVLFVIVSVGTVYDLTVTRGTSKPNHVMLREATDATMKKPRSIKYVILSSASAYRNIKKVFDTTHRKDDALRCIDGLRAMSMIWVVIGHVAVQSFWTEPWKNPFECLHVLQIFWTQVLSNGDLSVDSFMCISGFLVAYLTLKHIKEKDGKLDIGYFYLQRILRITPAYALILAFVCGPFKYMGKGPFWPDTNNYNIAQCRRVWWRNLLYINVYFDDSEVCLAPSWYLCQDTFFFLVSPMILIPMHRKPLLGMFLWITCFLGSILTSAYLIHFHDLASFNTWQMREVQRMQYIKEIYHKPWCRITPFLVGILCGYLYNRKSMDPLKLNKMFVAATWLLASAILLAAVFGTFNYSNGSKNMTNEVFTAYGSLVRTGWAIAIGWIIMACSLGYGGVVNAILSNKLLIPLSRLSYSYFLVHFPIITHYMASRKENFTQDLYSAIYTMTAMVTVNFAAAMLLHLLAEGPIIELRKNLMERQQNMTVAARPSHTRESVKLPLVIEEWANESQPSKEYSLSLDATSNYDSESDVYWDLQEEMPNEQTRLQLE